MSGGTKKLKILKKTPVTATFAPSQREGFGYKKKKRTSFTLGRLNWIGLGIVRTPGKETVQESQRTEEKTATRTEKLQL